MGIGKRVFRILRALIARAYSRRMPGKLKPVPYPRELEGLEGKWVAVVDNNVLAAAETSRDLVAEMRRRHITGATVRYVAPAEEGYKVGLG